MRIVHSWLMSWWYINVKSARHWNKCLTCRFVSSMFPVKGKFVITLSQKLLS
jgi:hypothetical protein